MPHAGLATPGGIVPQRQAAREMFLASQGAGGPIERVAAIIDGAAGFGGLVDGAEVLPFGGAHFGTGSSGARGVIREEMDDELVGFDDEEAAEFVEPEGAVGGVRGFCDGEGGGAGEWGGMVRAGVAGTSVVVVEGFEVFLQLESGVDLNER